MSITGGLLLFDSQLFTDVDAGRAAVDGRPTATSRAATASASRGS